MEKGSIVKYFKAWRVMRNVSTEQSKPSNIGLVVRRLVAFALPAIVIAGSIGGVIAMNALKPKPEEKEDTIKATPVAIAYAKAEPVNLSVTTQGEALPLREIDLTPEVSGRVIALSPSFIEGGTFSEGDVLLKIQPTEFELRVTQAKAAVAQANNRYASELAEAEIAKREWEEIGNGEGSSLALRRPQLAEAAAALASAKAAQKEAEFQLSRTEIRAPFNGRVQSKSVDIGQFITAAAPIGRIFSSDVMQIALPLTDAELGRLGLSVGFVATKDNPGTSVTLTAPMAGKVRNWTGRVTRTSSSFDRETRVLFAYVEVTDPYGTGADKGAPLAAGLFVTATIDGRAIENSVVVPRAALRGKDKVYIAREDDTMEIRQVAVAASNKNEAVLIDGLVDGEAVIISPVRGAAEGMAIAVSGKTSSSSEAIAEASI